MMSEDPGAGHLDSRFLYFTVLGGRYFCACL